MVSMELYRTFIAIYREGTISKAAISIDVTQPAASQQLALLEKQLQIKLFERTPRKMLPTDSGHELYTKISDSFDWINHVSEDFVKQDVKQSLFHIGVPLEFCMQELVPKVKSLPFRISFIFGSTKELENLLKKGEIEMMIATYKNTLSGMCYHDIFEENFWLVSATTQVIPEQYSRSWIIKQKWVSYDTKLSIIRRYFQQRYGIKPAISPQIILPNLHAMLLAVKEGIGMSVLPDYICQEAVDSGDIQIVDAQKDITNVLYLVCKEDNKEKFFVKSFLKIL